MLKIISVLVFSIFLSGCQSLNTVKDSQKSYLVEDNNEISHAMLDRGLATQFPYSNEYSLTVGHVHDFGNNINFVSRHPNCDVAILNKTYKSDKTSPMFEDSKIGENVTLYGHAGGKNKETIVNGKVVDYKIVSLGEYSKECRVAVVDARVQKGMSGGPVYNEKGKIVGVIFAVNKNKDKNLSYFVPYESFSNWLSKI